MPLDPIGNLVFEYGGCSFRHLEKSAVGRRCAAWKAFQEMAPQRVPRRGRWSSAVKELEPFILYCFKIYTRWMGDPKHHIKFPTCNCFLFCSLIRISLNSEKSISVNKCHFSNINVIGTEFLIFLYLNLINTLVTQR